MLTDWHPRLWWGRPTHDDYDVKVRVPDGHQLGATGLPDTKAGGRYRAEKVRSFGLYLAKGVRTLETSSAGVSIRALFWPDGEKCAELVLSTAANAVDFYWQRFGFYPFTSLTIIPGEYDEPYGGYPVATGLIAIHGMTKVASVPKLHWQWITAHEIGHQYWGDWVLEKESPGWLWIGLGIYADREYVLARGLGLDKHRALVHEYLWGVKRYYDTTMSLTLEQYARVNFDCNNVVVHGKGFATISALAWVMGRDAFDRSYQRCLREFAGRPLGPVEFQRICEEEAGQDLDWFFSQWVRSNRYLYYRVGAVRRTSTGAVYRTEVQVERLGTLRMPVPVEARFQDGSRQEATTDRLRDVDTITFTSASPLVDVMLDPRRDLAMVDWVLNEEEGRLVRRLEAMAWMPEAAEVTELLGAAKAVGLRHADLWFKLGMGLYHAGLNEEALEAFAWPLPGEVPWVAAGDPGFRSENRMRILLCVWQGHVLDVLARRAEALEAYRAALSLSASIGGFRIRQDHYRLVIDPDWIQTRLETPFSRSLINQS